MDSQTPNKILVPSQMYSTFLQEGALDSLAFFCHAKSVYENPTFYNCNLSQLAEKVGVSVSTARARVSYLMGKGVVCRRDGHFCFMGLGNLYQKYQRRAYNPKIKKAVLQISVGQSMSETKALVRAYTIPVSVKRQQKQIGKKEEIKRIIAKAESNHFLTAVELRSYKKSLKNRGNDDASKFFLPNAVLTSKKTAELAGNFTSRTTGIKYRKLLERNGIAKTRRNYLVLDELEVNYAATSTFQGALAYFRYKQANGLYPDHAKLVKQGWKLRGDLICWQVVIEGPRIWELTSDLKNSKMADTSNSPELKDLV